MKKKKKKGWDIAGDIWIFPTGDMAVLPLKSDWELTEILEQLMRLDIYGFIVPHNLMP